MHEDGLMKSSPVLKRSVVVGKHKTSVSLENEFWTQLKGIAGAKHVTLSKLIAEIDEGRERRNLSSAIRVYVLEHSRDFSNSA
jgi:predicted DNA-binding ribbon-helix-helix protein